MSYCQNCADTQRALTAAAEREAAKDREIARLTGIIRSAETTSQLGDGVSRLVMALHGRAPKAADYLGGSDANMLHEAATALAAERQKAAALREWVEVALQEAPESGTNKSIQRYDEGRIHAYGMVKWKLDALGLSPDAPQPPGTTRETP